MFHAAHALRPAAARAPIPAPAAPHPLDRPARTEPDLDLGDLQIVQAESAQDPAQPFARALHAAGLMCGRPVPVTAAGGAVSPSPTAAR